MCSKWRLTGLGSSPIRWSPNHELPPRLRPGGGCSAPPALHAIRESRQSGMQVTNMWGEATSDPKSPARGGTDVTIVDIARALNVSHTTVSRALADSPKISAETKARVRNAVEQLG